MADPASSDGARRIEVYDDALGLRATIAIHSTRRGPAFGGIRRARYESDAAAGHDAAKLAEAMTFKCALAGLDAGGAKTVVRMPEASRDVDWPMAYRCLGEAIEALDGEYVCGPDVGTGPAELDAVRAVTRHVNPAANDAGRSTAAGVRAGLSAVLEALELPVAGARVAVMGLGSVGGALATSLLSEGAEVFGADPDPEACARAEASGVTLVSPAAVLHHPCDVLMPCALGGILTRSEAERVRCRAVCGSANNQLATADAGWALHRRGILHAPDVVVSAGAVIEGVLTVQRGEEPTVRAAIAHTIGALQGVTARVLEAAAREDRPASVVARDLAEAALR